MKTILITGIGGFFGSQLHKDLCDSYQVHGVQRKRSSQTNIRRADVTQAKDLHEIIFDVEPDYIIHLAASLKDNKNVMFHTNVTGFRNILDSVRDYSEHRHKMPVILFPNSSAIYDPRNVNPVSEDSNISPTSYYGLTKYINTLTAKEYSEIYQMKIVGLRMFNLCGPGQSERFVISGFCKQLAELALHPDEERTLRSGGLNFVRDFVDVRDASRAVQNILKGNPCRGQHYEYYNVCSGVPTRIYDIVSILKELVNFDFQVKENTVFDNHSEIVELYGNYDKIRTAYQWEPQIPLRQTVKDTFEFWMKQLKKNL
jgi:GDP-4-dehydro-6-deoxy-D-mannose reductase